MSALTESAPLRTAVSADLSGVAEAWDQLVDETGSSLFQRPGWYEAWWSVFGTGSLELHLAYRGDRLVAVLPLARRSRALRSLTNWHSARFEIVAIDGEARQAVAVRAFASGARSLDLGFLDPAEATVEVICSAGAAAGFRVSRHPMIRSPYLDIETGWEAYERSLSRNHRADLRRRWRRLEERGQVTIDVADGSRSLEALLEEGFAIEASGWKHARGTAIVSSQANRAFYERIARWTASRGWLRLCFLRVDGEALAFLYDFEENGVHYYQKGGYRPEHADLSPAKVLLHSMIERAFRDGLRRFEFLGADDPYKLQWASAVHALERLRAFAPGPAGRVEQAAWLWARPVVRRGRSLLRGG